ncbi:hypothetical protein KUTeg_005199 [Tegillarca granosa]|uniref:DOCKER domain-containing protein n=1 Tax=Tegillarca granosa TaxID=220873 RepID=A0ABQ9FNK7_TEGGR|nr:hypothetical protein KUTeg_005199 [Tegillarca granosa]
MSPVECQGHEEYLAFRGFMDKGNYNLWSCFFHCSISFLTQRALQLESFSQSKRNKVINRYKDMRRETGFEIRQMWFQLGIHKIYFIPALVGPILEMTLIPETELRKATIPIFFDMMQCEFTQVDPVTRKIRANFQQVENELIIQLDALVEGGCGDEEYKQLMYDILYQLCCGHSTIKEQGIVFVEIIKTLLQRLLEYRNIIQNEIKEHRMSCIVNLLNYYHDIGRQEMYIRYLYKLCELHLECDNYTEAANTLLLHVNLLQWSDDNLPLMLQSNWYPDSHTHRELKEQLYYNIIQYYDKGKMWEKGIQLCKELVNLYETELFDYERLSFVLKRQADLYSCIIKELRPDPEYFRVGYYGRGFPEFLQNIVFIYRGKEYERLSDFNARMQTLFPNAELLKTLSPPSDEIKESDKQYLQINAVAPVLELQERFKDKPKMWLERTYLTISYPLPGILCWFPVINTELVRVSPLECAIETLESTNKKINSAIEQHALEQVISVQNLGMLLNGVVDASVNGGISNYKVRSSTYAKQIISVQNLAVLLNGAVDAFIFYADDYGKSEEDMQLVIKLKELTRNQLFLLKEAMAIHKRKCAENMRPFHAHMEERFEEMCNLIKSEYNLKVPENSYMNTLKRFKSMSAVSLSRVSEAFVSITGASPEMNYATPVTRTSTPNRTPSVFVRAEKTQSSNSLVSPSKGLQQKVSSNLQNIFNINLNKRASFATSEHSSDGSGGNNNSDSDIGEERAPPPLPEKPEKHHYADYSNLPDKETPPPTHTRLGHRKSKPVPPLPTENDTPEPSNPPPVPKKTHHSSSPFSKTNNHK